jgi:hypothetical protein
MDTDSVSLQEYQYAMHATLGVDLLLAQGSLWSLANIRTLLDHGPLKDQERTSRRL